MLQTSRTVPQAFWSRPEHPADRREQDERRSELGDAEQQDHRGQEAGEGNAGHDQAEAGQQRLDDRRRTDPQRDGANGLSGQDHGVLAALGRQAPAETAHASRRRFPVGVQDGGEGHDHEELDQHAAHAAEPAQYPPHRVRGVGRHPGGEALPTGVRRLCPGGRDFRSDDGELSHPVRRLRQALLRHRPHPVRDLRRPARRSW